MITALKGNEIILANEVKEREEFKCIECKQKAIFVDAIFKIKHFRHFITSNCEPEPETEQHLNMKKFFIENLNLKRENIEVPLGFARPDLYLQCKKIAIEVQHSNLNYQKFIERTKNYTKNDIAVLWIFDSVFLKTDVIGVVLKKAHELYFGRVYVFKENNIYPVHFKTTGRIVSIYYDDPETPYEERFGSYYKNYKRKKLFDFGEKITNFNFKIQRNTWKGNNFLIASFLDKPWWKND